MAMLAVASWLVLHGCALPCAAGVLANLERESRFNPAAVSKSGIGLPQWAGTRRARLLALLGAGWRNGEKQLEFMLIELEEFGLRSRLFAETSPASAARIFMQGFEMPRAKNTSHAERRAEQIYKELVAR